MKRKGSALFDFCVEILAPNLFGPKAGPVQVQWIITLYRKSPGFEGSSRPFVKVREAFVHVDQQG